MTNSLSYVPFLLEGLERDPRVDVMGGPDLGAPVDVMGGPDLGAPVNVMGGPDTARYPRALREGAAGSVDLLLRPAKPAEHALREAA